MTRRIDRRVARGARATVSRIVVQLGLAMMPRCSNAAAGFTSGTTSGTPGSRRKALELSITTAPAPGRHGVPTGGRRRHRQRPAPDPPHRSSAPPRVGSSGPGRPRDRWPAERGEARGISSATGKARWPRSWSNSCPTAPVTPRTAILRGRWGRVRGGLAGMEAGTVEGGAFNWAVVVLKIRADKRAGLRPVDSSRIGAGGQRTDFLVTSSMVWI